MERKVITDVYLHLWNTTYNKIIFQIPSSTKIYCMNKLTFKETIVSFAKDAVTTTDTVVAAETSTGGNGTGGKGSGGKP